MATSGSGTSTGLRVTTGRTLAELVAKWRLRLDDTLEPYMWSNEELAEYADYIQKQLMAEMPIIEDREDETVCNVSYDQSHGYIELDPRIVRIKKAWIDGESTELTLCDNEYMDSNYGDWMAEDSDTTITEDTPTILVIEGVGTNRAYLYPPADAAGTVHLSVIRMPLIDVTYSENSGDVLEIDEYVHLIVHGIMQQAYLKQDADAYDPKKSEQHRILWEGQNGNGGDKDKIRRMVMRKRYHPATAVPLTAFM